MADTLRDPQTPREWREAVNAAHFYRCLADCQMYGLITGAENVNIARCDFIIERGAQLGYFPEDLLHAK